MYLSNLANLIGTVTNTIHTKGSRRGKRGDVHAGQQQSCGTNDWPSGIRIRWRTNKCILFLFPLLLLLLLIDGGRGQGRVINLLPLLVKPSVPSSRATFFCPSPTLLQRCQLFRWAQPGKDVLCVLHEKEAVRADADLRKYSIERYPGMINQSFESDGRRTDILTLISSALRVL